MEIFVKQFQMKCKRSEKWQNNNLIRKNTSQAMYFVNEYILLYFQLTKLPSLELPNYLKDLNKPFWVADFNTNLEFKHSIASKSFFVHPELWKNSEQLKELFCFPEVAE